MADQSPELDPVFAWNHSQASTGRGLKLLTCKFPYEQDTG